MCKLFYPILYHFDLSETQNIYVYLVEVQKAANSTCQLNPNEKNFLWKDVQQHIEMIGQKIVKIPSNGHCLLLAIKQCLYSDFKIQREEKNIAQKIRHVQQLMH